MLLNFAKGIIIGLALVIPGFSASTFAVATGLYEKIINAINSLRKQFKKSVLFLLPIAVGAVIGVLASASFIIYLINTFPLQSYSFFIGLVLGSIPVIYSRMRPQINIKWNYIFFVIGVLAILAMTFLAPETDNVVAIESIENFGHVASIALAGLIACSLLTIPGISGSIILMLLGQFGTIYGAVSNFGEVVIMLLSGEEGAFALGLSSFMILLVFAAGALVGLFAAARIIGFFLERRETTVYFLVMGLVLGAVVTLIDMGIVGAFATAVNAGEVALNILMMLAFAAVGFIFTRFIGKERIQKA